DVGVQDAHRHALGGERRGEVDGGGRFAHAALAGGHRVHAGEIAGLGERDDGFGRVPAQLLAQLRALRVVHHVEFDADLTDPRYVGDRRPDPVRDGLPHRTPRDGQVDTDVDPARTGVDVDTLDHPEFGEWLVDLRIVDLGQCG